MKNKNIMIVMGILIIIGIVLYTYVLIPTMNDFIISKQIDAQEQIITIIVNEVSTKGYVQIPIGNEVLTLVPYQQQEQQTTPQW